MSVDYDSVVTAFTFSVLLVKPRKLPLEAVKTEKPLPIRQATRYRLLRRLRVEPNASTRSHHRSVASRLFDDAMFR